MLNLFRSFSWTALLPLIGFAVALRSFGWLLPPEAWAAPGPVSGAWAGVGGVLAQAPLARVVLGAVAVTLIGFFTAASMQQHRLANAGTLPAFWTALLGSAAAAWLDFDAGLLAALAMTGAAHQLYGAYRHQGASLPVYNAGLLIGLAWLLSAPFVWMAGWGAVALLQLRKARGGDLLGLLIGVLTLPLIWGMYVFALGDLADVLPALYRGTATLPTVGGLRQNLAPLCVAAAATLLLVGVYGTLAARRPVQEQRAHRMYYVMLAFAWAAALLSGGFPVAPFLPPLGLLLGVYFLEAPRKPAGVALAIATAAVVGAHVYLAVAH